MHRILYLIRQVIGIEHQVISQSYTQSIRNDRISVNEKDVLAIQSEDLVVEAQFRYRGHKKGGANPGYKASLHKKTKRKARNDGPLYLLKEQPDTDKVSEMLSLAIAEVLFPNEIDKIIPKIDTIDSLLYNSMTVSKYIHFTAQSDFPKQDEEISDNEDESASNTEIDSKTLMQGMEEDQESKNIIIFLNYLLNQTDFNEGNFGAAIVYEGPKNNSRTSVKNACIDLAKGLFLEERYVQEPGYLEKYPNMEIKSVQEYVRRIKMPTLVHSLTEAYIKLYRAMPYGTLDNVCPVTKLAAIIYHLLLVPGNFVNSDDVVANNKPDYQQVLCKVQATLERKFFLFYKAGFQYLQKNHTTFQSILFSLIVGSAAVGSLFLLHYYASSLIPLAYLIGAICGAFVTLTKESVYYMPISCHHSYAGIIAGVLFGTGAVGVFHVVHTVYQLSIPSEAMIAITIVAVVITIALNTLLYETYLKIKEKLIEMDQYNKPLA